MYGAKTSGLNGTYTVRVVANQVFDRADSVPNAASSAVLGTFTIAIPVPGEAIFLMALKLSWKART